MSYVKVPLVAICLSMAAGLVLTAQPKVGDRVAVQIEVAASPAEQLRRCDELLARAQQASDPTRRVEGALAVMANLDVIRKRWPDATEAITQATLSQADVALEFDMPRNALAVLTAAPKKTTDDLGIELRFARAYDALQDGSSLEQHLLAAEKLTQRKQGHRSDADAALQMLASFYLNRGQPREAVKRYRAAADLPGQPAVRAATLCLSALKAAVHDQDDRSHAEAKSAADAVEEHLRRGRGAGQSSAVAQALAAVERDLARLKADNGL
jgi:hypothetical protein